MTDRRKRRRRTSNGLIDGLNALLTLLVIGLVVLGGGFLYVAGQYYGAGPLDEERIFRVESGNSLTTTATRLEEQGFVSSALIFRYFGERVEGVDVVKAGDFALPPHASMSEIFRELTQGTPIRYAVTIPEGWTAWQAVQRLNEEERLTGAIAAQPAEGSILPGSYEYVPGETTRQALLGDMQAAMAETLAEIWAGRQADLPLATPAELQILASIVEKETGVADERPLIAAVFINRLREGMRLQSDPTIIYGITQGQSTLDRGIRRSEIEAETPYNTYRIDGLPPTPIANPGIEALKATAHPDSHDYLYFVAKGATPSEGHVFAQTYEEHQKNVARYRQVAREAAEQAQAEADALQRQIAEEGLPTVTLEPQEAHTQETDTQETDTQEPQAVENPSPAVGP